MEAKPSIFRKEAREYYLHHRRQEGDVLHLAPRWTRWTYWVLLGLLVAAAGFCVVGTVSEYASGPALVRVTAGAEDGATYVQAFLPGYSRPYLRPGMPLRVGVDGFRSVYYSLTIESVEESVISPGELERIVGKDLAAVVAATGPFVMLRARMPSRTLLSEGRVLSYADGMPARAEAAIRTEPLLLSLIPGLRALLPHDG